MSDSPIKRLPLPTALTMENIIDVWKETVDVQQHFNDLELRIRNYAVTVLVAVLGVAGFSLKERMEVVLFGKTISLAILLLLAGAVGWVAFYFMDRWWYHRLLYGAVQHAQMIESSFATTFPELGLTNAISAASPFKVGKKEIRTTRKIDIFYGAMLIILVLMMIALYVAHVPQQTGSTTQPNKVITKEAEGPHAGSTTVGDHEPSPQPSPT